MNESKRDFDGFRACYLDNAFCKLIREAKHAELVVWADDRYLLILDRVQDDLLYW